METLNKKFLKKNKSAFTLVELIIVITILAILATIAFISFQGYSKNARDGNRLTTMKNIEKGIVLYNMKSGKYPQPDESINVEASGTLIGYQGIIGDTISRNIKMNITPKDPFDSSNYLYSVNSDNSKYQLLGYLETPDYLSLLNQSYAVDYSSRYVKTLGDKVGVILDTNKSPVAGVTKVDVATGSTVYNVYFSDNDSVNGSGNVIFSNMTTRRSELASNSSLVSLDSSLVLYWDMKTLTGGKLKDLSQYHNDGTLSGTTLKDGKAFINGTGAGIFVDDNNSFNFYQNNSITVGIKFSNINTLGTYYPLFSQHYNGNGGNGSSFSLSQLSDGYGAFFTSNGTWSPQSKTLDRIWDSNTHILYGVYNGSELKIYNDGILNGSITDVRNIANSNYKIVIGNDSSFVNPPKSLEVSEARIYNRALSDSEIQSLYNSTK